MEAEVWLFLPSADFAFRAVHAPCAQSLHVLPPSRLNFSGLRRRAQGKPPTFPAAGGSELIVL